VADKIFPTGFTQIGSVTATCTFPIDDGSTNYYAAISQIPSNIVYQDEGTNLNTAGQVTTVDFVGAVTASYAAGKLTVTIPGGGGLSDGDYGDVTVSGGGTTLTIDPDTITFAKMQEIATDNLIGRSTAGTGNPELVPCTAVGREILASVTRADAARVVRSLGLVVASKTGHVAY